MEEMREDGRWDLLPKKEQYRQEKVYKKLQKNLGGLKKMTGLPGAIFIMIPRKKKLP
jgi:small subunit ribosomal protein S2